MGFCKKSIRALVIVLSIFTHFCVNADEAKQTIHIVCIGDSLTEGYGVAKESAFPALLEKKLLKRGIQSKVTNAGISGSTSASAPSRMRWSIKAKPQWVILALGANDGLRGLSVAAMQKNLQSAIDIAKEAHVRVLLAGMYAPPNYGAQYTQSYASVFANLAKQNKQVVYLPFLLEGVAAKKELNLPDGIHPNEKGYEVVAQLLFKALESKL